MALKCYLCGKRIKHARTAVDVYLQDDEHRIVPVGSDCAVRVHFAGGKGIAAVANGVRVFETLALAKSWKRLRNVMARGLKDSHIEIKIDGKWKTVAIGVPDKRRWLHWKLPDGRTGKAPPNLWRKAFLESKINEEAVA